MNRGVEIDGRSAKAREKSAVRLAEERFKKDYGSLPQKSDPLYMHYLSYLAYEREFVEKVARKQRLRRMINE